jgi:hypothetical protein
MSRVICIDNVYCILIVYIIFIYFLIGLCVLSSRKLIFVDFFEIMMLAGVHFVCITVLALYLLKSLCNVSHVESLICLSVQIGLVS